MEEEFRVSEQGIKDIKKKALVKALPIALLALATGLFASWFNSNTEHSIDAIGWSDLMIVPIILGVLAFSFFRAFKRQTKLLKSYRIVLKESVIVREQFDTPTIAIPYDEITSIKKVSSGAMVVQGKSSTESIVVYHYLEGLDRLEAFLSKTKPITKAKNWPILLPIMVVSALGSMAAVYLSNNKWVVGISGTSLTLFLVYSIYAIRRSKNIDQRIKRSVWWTLLVIFSVVVITCYKLFGILPI